MSVGEEIARAARRLAEAGVPAPRADAEMLAAHSLGVPRAEVARLALLGDPSRSLPATYGDLVEERAARVPLQHLTGSAPFRYLELRVGPGVFVPRPETEDVAGAAIDELTVRADAFAVAGPDASAPLAVDLCAGSAAIALALATEVPSARVVAAELSDDARAWAAQNIELLASGKVDLRRVDVMDRHDALSVLDDLLGRVDVVVSNPPYVPGDQEPIEPEVRDHDPQIALYGGGRDGLEVPRAVVQVAAALLRPGGLLVMEHADVQQPAVLATLTAQPAIWREPAGHADLTGRPRYVTARRV